MRKKKARQSSPQSSFLDTMDRTEHGENTIPEPAEPEIETVEFPKIVKGSFYCPDCGSKVILRPDGSAVCPKCVVKVPCKTAELERR